MSETRRSRASEPGLYNTRGGLGHRFLVHESMHIVEVAMRLARGYTEIVLK